MWCRLVDVYDGDTLTAIMPVGTEYYKFACRVYGIDTSEMKSKQADNKANAYRARNRMLQLCGVQNIQTDKPYTRKEIQAMLNDSVHLLWVKCRDMDKYGRVLLDPFRTPDEATPLSTILIQENLAYPYFGETKLTETQQSDTLAKQP